MTQITVPATMKAILQPDKASHKLILAEVPVPKPTHPDDVLVKVMATSPCKGELDWALWAPDFIGPDKTPIPGQDLAGIVVQVSAAPSATASKFRPGDQVYARIEANRPGAGAEFVVARGRELALRPRSLDWIQTAASPISALTAYQALFVQGTLDPAALPLLSGADGPTAAAAAVAEAARAKNAKLRVLITAASGSVGGWAVQLAKAAGAGSIVAVCGPKNTNYVVELGATEVVDYTQQTLAEWVASASAQQDRRECDLVIDCVGGDTLAQCWSAVRGQGVGALISVCGQPEDVRPAGLAGKELAKALWFVIDPVGTDLEILARLIDAGLCRPLVDSVVGFEDGYAAAWEKVEGGHARGKVVVKVDPSI